MTIRQFGFQDQLVISTGTSANKTIGMILLEVIPGARRAIQSLQHDDKTGVDWWVETGASDRRIAVDCKIREDDPIPRYNQDDLALETWSVVEKKIIGWSLDDKKRTDYVFWIFKDTGRWCVVPFSLLVRAFRAKKDEWLSVYKVAKQNTEGRYHSECVFVDRRELWAEIYRQAHGTSDALRVEHAEQLTLFNNPASPRRPIPSLSLGDGR